MDFALTEEQRIILEAVKDFARNEVAPFAAQSDQDHALAPSILPQLKELGFLGSYLPQEYGGAGMDFFSYCLLVEELSKACASTGVLVSAHTSLAGDPLARAATKAQKKQYLSLLTQGEKIGCFLLTEPGAGSDAGSIQTRYMDQGDHYEVSGNKIFVTNGGYLGLGILFATQDSKLGHEGISAFILDLRSEGVTLLKNEEKMGIRASYTSAFALEKVKIPKENLLGKEGKGFHLALETLNGGRIGIAAQALGIGQAAFELARDYALERKQFGKALSRFQAIQFKLADMALGLESARLLTYKAAWLKDQKKDYSLASAMAKVKASEVANACAKEALQIFGGYGFTTDYPLERLYRDAKITEIYEGTSEIQRIVMAKEILNPT